MGIEQTFVKLVLAGALAMSVSACGDETGRDYTNVKLYINEVQSKNSTTYIDPGDGSYPDWLELYNAGGEAVNLEAFILGDSKNEWALPTGVGTIAAKGFFVLFADDSTDAGPTHLPFKFSSSSDHAVLKDPTGKQLDSVEIPASASTEEESFQRFPDGGGSALVSCIHPTPNASNGDSCAASTGAD